MGHKKHSSRKSKHNTTNNNNNNNEDDNDNSIITSNIRTNNNNNKAINDVNQYIYKFISSEEFNNCYPIIAFQSSILLTCIEYLKIHNHHQLMDQNSKIPIRELLINAEKKIKDWEERARKSL